MKKIVGELVGGKTNPSPAIECWMPENYHKGIGLLILPGGAYACHADHEGAGYAEYFSRAGIASFVVSYRLSPEGFHHPAMLEDVLAAINKVRSSAEEFGIDPNKLGIMGSSAGGHLAAHTLVAWQEYESDISLRPDFGVLCYPVIMASGSYVHEGSIRNLAGETVSESLRCELSCEKQVSADTPPCFIWHTNEDEIVPVENSMLFAAALRKNAVPFELHIYEKGRHGLGLGATFDWASDCLRWIEETVK